MAIYKRDIVDINLETGNIHRSFLKHSIGMKDSAADHFGIRVFRNGEAVDLSGVSVQGVFMPPQGSPIAITSGNIVSGNVAEVVLPQACYNYDGPFTLAIKLVDSTNSVTGTMRIVDGVVDNTHASGTVAPTGTVPTYQEVLSAYEQAIAVIGNSVRFDQSQSLTDAQKVTARTNIAAASESELSDVKSAFETIKGAITDEEIANWADAGTSSYGTGWAKGYYSGSTGETVSSNTYIRSNSGHFFTEEEATLMEVFAPTGYFVRAYEYKSDGTFVGAHGSIANDTGSHFFFEFEKGNKFHFAMGKFTDADDCEDHYTDANFLATCIVKFYSLDSVTGYDLLSEQIENISTNLDSLFYTESITYEASQWRTGYYKASTGDYSSSGIYICTKADEIIANPNMTRLTAKAPDGYNIAVHEYTSGGVYVKTYGSIKSTNEVNVATNEGRNYRFSIGRFATGTAGDYLIDSFIGQIQVSIDELKLPSSDTKLNRTGDYEFFKVIVDRPLSFGGEEVIDNTEAEEVQCVLRLPTSYTRTGTPTRLVLMAHGAGGKIDPTASNPWYTSAWKDFCDDILAAGYALFDSNIFESGTDRGRAIGSPLYINVLKKAYDYIIYNYNVYDKIFAHGTSMGGVGATGFTHVYPDLVLAESSFAGRSFLRYLAFISGQLTSDTTEETDEEKLAIAKAYGYESVNALNTDKFSHAVGCCPELSLIKYVDGVAVIPPDRVTDFQNWMEYYTEPELLARNASSGVRMGKRSVPYKAWNSWEDGDEKYAKLEEVLASAYNRGNSCPYYVVNYETGTHSQISLGTINDMRDQLIAWYKRWE